MPTSYSQADESVTALLADVMRRFRPDLDQAGVRVRPLMSATDQEGEPALKSRGVAVLADVRVVPLLWRAALDVPFDALLRIDLAAWAAMPDAEHESLLHHELMHLVLAKTWAKADGTLGFAADDLGRPKLKTRPGDVSPPDGFAAVIAHHGLSSHEYRAYCRAREFAGRALAGELSADDHPLTPAEDRP